MAYSYCIHKQKFLFCMVSFCFCINQFSFPITYLVFSLDVKRGSYKIQCFLWLQSKLEPLCWYLKVGRPAYNQTSGLQSGLNIIHELHVCACVRACVRAINRSRYMYTHTRTCSRMRTCMCACIYSTYVIDVNKGESFCSSKR